MNSIQRIIDNYRSINDQMAGNLHYIETAGNPDIFYKKAFEWRTRPYPVKDKIDEAILAGLRRLAGLMGLGSAPTALCNSVISQVFGAASFFRFACNQKKNIAVYDFGNFDKLKNIVERLNEFYVSEFQTELTIRTAPAAFGEEFKSRLEDGEDYFLKKHGEWTQEFIDNLNDEISKISFRTFLKQRLEGWLMWGSLAMYPIQLPAETAQWRQDRRNHKPPLPELFGCSPWAKNIFHLHTYIYEQYAIPGIVEAAPGSVIIDAGAYNGDTAIYFSRKAGEKGKVYAFEADSKNINDAQTNIDINNCKNVEVLLMALSDTKGEINFSLNKIASSNSHQIETGGITVPCTDLDSFVGEKNIRVDYIKSDIEGGEMRLLQGAKETIKRDGPICGIAPYHKREDYHTIPKFLKN